MTTHCPWWERVSAALDGEAVGAERGAVLDHASSCSICQANQRFLADLSFTVPRAGTPLIPVPYQKLDAAERRWLGGRWTRRLLVVAALVIVVASVPTYLRGGADGPDAHNLRHLAAWQIGFGVGLVVAAIMARLSHAMLALGATFAALTIAATVTDIATGHQGPWDESVHLVEVIGFVLLWRVTPPHLRPFSRPRGRAHRRHRSRTFTEPNLRPSEDHPPNRR